MRQRFIIAIIAFLSLFPLGAEAHILDTDGTIGGVLHIEPDDNPTAGVPTAYVIEFQDTTSRFILADCACTATITGPGSTIIKQPLDAQDKLTSRTDVTFPTAGAYTIAVTGTAKRGAIFESFHLAYLIRVEAGNGDAKRSVPPLLWLGIGLTLAFALLGAYAREHISSLD